MDRRLIASGLAGIAMAISGSAAAQADAVADYYKGKAITIYIGFGVGGGYDAYSRVFARTFGKHVPGNPQVLPKNMPGAGSLKAANFVANAAPKDGTTLGVFATSTALEPLFGSTRAKFKTLDFGWLGSMTGSHYSCGVWKSSGVTKFDQIRKQEIIFGSTGPAAVTSQHAKVIKNLLGGKLKIIYGYKGTKGINLAMRRGEVNGSCGLTEATLLSRWHQDLANGNLKVIVHFGRKSAPVFGDTVSAYDLVKTKAEKQTLDVIFRQGEIGRPVASTPGVPAARAAALKKAFAATMKDPAFLADAKKARLLIDPIDGDAVVDIIKSFYAMPASVIASAKKAIDRK